MEELDAVFAQLGIQADSAKDSPAGGAVADKKKKKKEKKAKDEDASGPGDESVSPTRGPAAAAAAQEQGGDADEDDQDAGPVDPAAVSDCALTRIHTSRNHMVLLPLAVLYCFMSRRAASAPAAEQPVLSNVKPSDPCAYMHPMIPCSTQQAKARLLAAKKKGDAKKKSALASAALAEAQARKAKLSKQKDTKAYNQMPTR